MVWFGNLVSAARFLIFQTKRQIPEEPSHGGIAILAHGFIVISGEEFSKAHLRRCGHQLVFSISPVFLRPWPIRDATHVQARLLSCSSSSPDLHADMTGKGSTVLWDTSLYNQAVNESTHQTAWDGPSNIISCLKKYTPEKSGHSEHHQCGLSPAHHCTKAWARLYVFKDTILYLNQMALVVLSAYISLQDNIFLKIFFLLFHFLKIPLSVFGTLNSTLSLTSVASCIFISTHFSWVLSCFLVPLFHVAVPVLHMYCTHRPSVPITTFSFLHVSFDYYSRPAMCFSNCTLKFIVTEF